MTSVKRDRPARYSDLEALPENVVGEIIDGELIVSPRPAYRHTATSSLLGARLIQRFWPKRGGGGPGGWWILDEPELHIGEHVIVPDMAGWRVERLPAMPDGVGCRVPPDWLCEVLSPSTQRLDRIRKMRVYARAEVKHVWLLDPRERTLEVFELVSARWTQVLTAESDEEVRAPPFEELEIDLAELWAPVEGDPT